MGSNAGVKTRLTNPIILVLVVSGVVSIFTDGLLIPRVNQNIGSSALQPLKFAPCCQYANSSPRRCAPSTATGSKPLPMRWPPPTCSLLEMARVRLSCLTEAAELSGHVRTVSYQARSQRSRGLCSSLLQAHPCGI